MFPYETQKAICEFYQAITPQENAETGKIKYPRNSEIEETTVIKMLDDIFERENDELKSVLPKGKILYRAREIDPNTAYEDASCGFNAYYDEKTTFHCTGYNYYESKEPPICISSEGRNNIVGASYLYLADEKYTACAEIAPTIRGMVSLAEFEILKDLNIINFCDGIPEYFKPDLIEKYKVSPNKIIQEIFRDFSRVHRKDATYYVTQYISDYIRKAGYDGIKYRGAANYGTNYTIFNCHKSNIKFIESKIIATYGVEYEFYDIESEARLTFEHNHNHDFNSLKKELVNDIKKARKEKNNG